MAKLKEINVSLGLSIEVNNNWYRPNCGVVVEINEEDNAERRVQIWNKAWETVTDQINKTIAEIASAGEGQQATLQQATASPPASGGRQRRPAPRN